MKRLRLFMILFALLLTVTAAVAQQDTDGDGTPDEYDSCVADAGPPVNSGCPEGVTPDFDQDGVPDNTDLCYNEAGDAALLGCTAASFPDFDADSVADPFDACFDTPGLPNNSGCAEGVVPDLDGDTIPDAQDACPTEFGDPNNNGCQPDGDGDTIPDFADACPTQAGTTANYGCPSGTGAPDSDGDTVPDQFDACVNLAGDPILSGCPDTDGDGSPDPYDLCPNVAGSQELIGCQPVETGMLPANLVPITANNAPTVTEVARLILSVPSFDVAANGTLATRAGERVLIYDLSTPELNVMAEGQVGISGSPVAVSGDGRFVATSEFPPDFSGPPFVQIRDGGNGNPLGTYHADQRTSNGEIGVGQVAFHPTDPLLAVVEDAGAGFSSGFNSIISLVDTNSMQKVGELFMNDAVANIAFSSDGTRLAVDSTNGASMTITLWDTAARSEVGSFETTPIIHFMGTPLAFSPDGSLLAYGQPDGSVVLYDLNAAAARYQVQTFDASLSEVVSSIAYSPDGTVIAVAGGVPFSGGLTGSEVYPLVLLDAATGTELLRINTNESLIRDLEFSGDGTLLIGSAAVSLWFWGVGG